MIELFKWLSSTPAATSSFIILFSTLLLAMLLVFLIAFFQGREISFWPPKIGEKKQKHEKEAVSSETLDFVQSIRKWEGTWNGEANDIAIESEEELDSETHVNQKLKVEIKSSGNDTIKISGKIFIPLREDGKDIELQGIIEGESKVRDNYVTINYTIVGETFDSFGTCLAGLSGTGTTIKGHYLSRRIFGKATRAFGKVKFERAEHFK